MTGRGAKTRAGRATKAPSKPRGTKKSASALERLAPEELGAVMRALLARRPELRGEAEAIAGELLARASAEDVAEGIVSAVARIGYDDLNARAGDHGWGYVAPEEAADELLWEAIADEQADMLRKAQLGLYDAAFEVCKGLVMGLRRAKDQAKGDVLGWSPDFPGDAACRVATDLVRACAGGDRVAMEKRLAAVMEEVAPEWSRTFGLDLAMTKRA